MKSDAQRGLECIAAAAKPNARYLVGKLVLIDRGLVTHEGRKGQAILVAGVLVSEGVELLSLETITQAGSEQWDVEVVLVPRVRRRGLSARHRGTMESLLLAGLHDPDFCTAGHIHDTERVSIEGTRRAGDR